MIQSYFLVFWSQTSIFHLLFIFKLMCFVSSLFQKWLRGILSFFTCMTRVRFVFQETLSRDLCTGCAHTGNWSPAWVRAKAHTIRSDGVGEEGNQWRSRLPTLHSSWRNLSRCDLSWVVYLGWMAECDDQLYVSMWLGYTLQLLNTHLGVSVKVFCESD